MNDYLVVVWRFSIFPTSFVAISLTSAFILPILDIQAVPVVARQGEAIRIDVVVTYRGSSPIAVDILSYRHPCYYSLPNEWKAARKTEPKFGLVVGFNKALLQPGDQIRHTIDVGSDYMFVTAPGKYTIAVGGILATMSADNETSGWLRALEIKVPIQILPGEPKK